MLNRLKTRHVLIVAGVGIVLAFQNCAQDPGATFNSSTSSSSSYTSTLPFAYHAQLDTISYMSCSNITASVDPRAYFTIRAGAYSPQTGGLSMTPEFVDATKHFSLTDRAQAFANSDLNSNTLLSLSVRQVGNYQSVYTGSSTGPGQDLGAFLPALDSNAVAGPLAQTASGQMINYFPGPGDQRLMEASLRFLQYENVAQDLRTKLNSQAALLVAGYSNTSDPSDAQLRGPSSTTTANGTPTTTTTPTSNIYGTGYYLHFGLPKNYASGDLRALSSTNGIQEIDLQTGNYIPATWDCNANYEFTIVRPEDEAAGLVTCHAMPDRYEDATSQAALAAIRRVLRVEDWYVDVSYNASTGTYDNCVMPKGTGDYCYGDIGSRSVQYGQANCVDSATTVCPHIISVCLRK